MTTPKASIVVPSRGGAARLPFLFDALRAQTDPSWEAIVVVDGDVDDSAVVIDAVRDELPVTGIVFPENRGRSAALNAGFAAARGDVLIRCDDDLRPRPDYVAQHVAQHEGASRGASRGAIGLYLNQYPDTPYARAYGRERDGLFRREAYSVSHASAWRYWAGNVSVTRETFDRVGGYDTAFRAYGWEDVDWGYRLHQAGGDVTLVSALETPHHVAAVTTEIRVKRAFYSGAARRAFVAKHGAAALGEGTGSASLWAAVVERTAMRNGLEALLAGARRADRALPRMPHYIAEKRVAWLVEAASLSGEMHPEEVGNDV